MNRYLIRWANFSVYSISAAPTSGITYVADDILIAADLLAAKIGLTALGIDCTKIDEEIANPTIQFN
ncbi:hypothetical protein [Solitalea lacus]|uniref:hypothetical protein n=1 Tax=Solitalea lacus TaxID=2911172 RepID=UPI001EDA956D|nr:hypothetical protein [Solitalea lacus]UKJ09069.1 hypothetical protein L2B55_07855 [Solitalea lacus]